MGVLNFEQTALDKLSVHFVGNMSKGEQLQTTESQFQLNDEKLYNALQKYFLSPFKGEEFFCFQDPKAAVADIVAHIFDKPNSFHTKSKELAQYLYQCSANNKKIKGGEFYVTYLKECIVEDEVVDAIGIFKSENKDVFLKAKNKKGEADLFTDEGININKLDKGCIIYNTFQEEGFKVVMVDNNSSIHTALYWKTDFLGVVPVDTEYFMTNQYMEMMKGFSRDYLNTENEVAKEDQLAFLQKSNEYFSSSDVFDSGQFAKEVIIEPEVAEAFTSYKEGFEEDKHLPTMERFSISQPAVEKHGQKFFRSVIKLDKNFHVYVHGNAEFLERGYDEEKKMHYYKLYYNNES